MVTPEELENLVKLRNEKMIAGEKYQQAMDLIIPKMQNCVYEDDPLFVEVNSERYMFVWSRYYNKAIFKKVPPQNNTSKKKKF